MCYDCLIQANTAVPSHSHAAIVDSGSWRPIHERIGELQRQKVTCSLDLHILLSRDSYSLRFWLAAAPSIRDVLLR